MGVSSSCFQVGCFLMLWTSMLNFMILLVQMQVWEIFGRANKTLWKMSWQKDPLKLFQSGIICIWTIVTMLSLCLYGMETACFWSFLWSCVYFSMLLWINIQTWIKMQLSRGWKSVCQLLLCSPWVQHFDPSPCITSPLLSSKEPNSTDSPLVKVSALLLWQSLWVWRRSGGVETHGKELGRSKCMIFTVIIHHETYFLWKNCPTQTNHPLHNWKLNYLLVI